MPSASKKHSTRSRDAFVIVSIVSTIVAGLVAFERTTGLSASMRGTAVYNVIPMPYSPDMQDTGEEARLPTVSTLTKERLCERVVKQFGWHSDIWERVNERILERLGFKCSR